MGALRSERRFDGDAAREYERLIRGRVPGYDTIHQLLPAILDALLPARASLLIAGVGTGAELIDLCERSRGWRFVALDPEPDMLRIARQRAEELRLTDRIEFLPQRLEEYSSERPFDASLSILVSHFVPDDGSRLAFFRKLAGRTRPDGCAIVVEMIADSHLLQDAWLHWLRQRGASFAEIAEIQARFEASFHPIGETRLRQLLAQAGLEVQGRFAQALTVSGFVTRRTP